VSKRSDWVHTQFHLAFVSQGLALIDGCKGTKNFGLNQIVC